MAAKWCPKTTHLLVGTKSRPLSRRSAGVARSGVQGQNFGGDEFAVEAVAQGVAADRGHHQPHGIDLFAAVQSDGGDGQRAQQRDCQPDQNSQGFGHGFVGVRVRTYCGESVAQAQSAREIRMWRERPLCGRPQTRGTRVSGEQGPLVG